MKIGLIGCGFIGHKHVQSLAQLPSCSLTAVSDVIPERMQRLATDDMARPPRQHQDYRDLLQDPDVEVVAITTISGLHAKVALGALAHGKHVVIEKPMALSIQEARAVIGAAATTGRKVAVCHQKRFLPHLQELQRLVRQGKLGQLVYGGVTLCYNRDDAYYKAGAWRGSWAQDGGVLLNQAIHNIDLLLWMMGAPVSVQGSIARLLRPIEAEDTGMMVMQLPSGALARVEATVCADSASANERLTLVGTQGSVELTGKFFEIVLTWRVEGEPEPVWQPVDPYALLYQDLDEAIREGREPLVNGTEGALALEAILGAYASAKQKGMVRLPLAEFSLQEMRDVLGDAGRC